MLPYVNLNGTLVAASEARISVFDHGLLYGDGLFETMRVERGRVFRPEAHLARLESSAGRIHLALPWTSAQLIEALDETRAMNGLHAGALRLTVTRGEGAPVPDSTQSRSPSFLITARHTPALPEGIRACFAGRHPQAHVPGIKSLSYQPFLLARDEAAARGFQEALLCAEDEVIEGSISSLFVVHRGELRTPPLESGCLPGTMRALVLELASQLGTPARERGLKRTEVLRADEVFVTSALAGVLPVLEVEDEAIGGGKIGPVTRQLREALSQLLDRELGVSPEEP